MCCREKGRDLGHRRLTVILNLQDRESERCLSCVWLEEREIRSIRQTENQRMSMRSLGRWTTLLWEMDTHAAPTQHLCGRDRLKQLFLCSGQLLHQLINLQSNSEASYSVLLLCRQEVGRSYVCCHCTWSIASKVFCILVALSNSLGNCCQLRACKKRHAGDTVVVVVELLVAVCRPELSRCA